MNSQRDPKHKDIPLGFARHGQTIGSHGCTISCIAELANIPTVEVNDRLKSVNGFVESSVIWSKINEAIPWLEFEWREYYFNQERIEAAIARNGFCLTEVDFDGTTRTDDKHWINCVPGGIHDPWPYPNRDLELRNKYPLVTGFAIINKKGGAMPDDPLESCLKDREKFWGERDEVFRLLGTDSVESSKSVVAGLKSRITTLSNECGTAQAEVKNREEQVGRLNTQLLEIGDQLKLIDSQLKTKQVEVDRFAKEKGFLEIENGKLQAQIDTLKAQQVQGGVTLTIWEFIQLLLKQKVTIGGK